MNEILWLVEVGGNLVGWVAGGFMLWAIYKMNKTSGVWR